MPVITLLTDFGLRDAFVGTMKGVILGFCPGARIVDLSHEITPQRIEEGSYVLRTAYTYFPDDTVHVAVVDPGVGGDRRAIIVETPRFRFVGPDNGVFAHIYARESSFRVFSVTESRYMLQGVSNTFHGRDVFAPVAAHLSLGEPASAFGAEIRDYHTGSIAEPLFSESRITGHVLHIDRFGNVISNIEDSLFLALTRDKPFRICLAGLTFDHVSASYDGAAIGTALAIINSDGLLEIALNKGSAAQLLGVVPGDQVEVEINKRDP